MCYGFLPNRHWYFGLVKQWLVLLPLNLLLLQLQPFNGLFSRTTWVSRYQKGKTNLDFTGARDSEWMWHQLGHMQACTSLQTDNHANTPPLVFYRPDALPAAQPTASKHWRHPLNLLDYRISNSPICGGWTYFPLHTLMWGGTRKVKPIWIFLKQETVSGSGISWAICSWQITMPEPHHS